jgi:hypothetical protein
LPILEEAQSAGAVAVPIQDRNEPTNAFLVIGIEL